MNKKENFNVTDDIVNASSFESSNDSEIYDAIFSDESKNTCIMEIEDVFSIAGRGVVVTGVVKDTSVSAKETVLINDKPYVVTAIEHYKKLIDTATKDMGVGILINGAKSSEFKKGDIIYKNS